jgi:murein DD-endopeptidase MepM/ murein hydrolase activator NlpD
MSDASGFSSLSQVPTDLLTPVSNRWSSKLSAANDVSAGNQKSELKKIAQEFEAIFVAQLLKEMRATIDEVGSEDSGYGKAVYTELFDQQISLNMAHHGTLGISDILYKNMEKRMVPREPEAASEIKQDSKASPADSKQLSPPESEIKASSSEDISVLQLPVHAQISSSFGLRKDPFSGQAKFHRGVDLAAPEGTPVVAALPGKVVSAGYESGYGNSVLLEHDGGIRTRYGHLSSIKVRQGDVVTSESALGAVGSTGHSTGPHLHFEVMRMGKPVDPLLSANSLAVHTLNFKKSS